MSRLKGIRVGFRVWIQDEDTLAHCDECGETHDLLLIGEHIAECRAEKLKEKFVEDAEWAAAHR